MLEGLAQLADFLPGRFAVDAVFFVGVNRQKALFQNQARFIVDLGLRAGAGWLRAHQSRLPLFVDSIN
jgi:hypothetical protein